MRFSKNCHESIIAYTHLFIRDRKQHRHYMQEKYQNKENITATVLSSLRYIWTFWYSLLKHSFRANGVFQEVNLWTHKIMPVLSLWMEFSVKSKRRVVNVLRPSLNILAFISKDFIQPLASDWWLSLWTISAQHYTAILGSVEHGCSFAGLLNWQTRQRKSTDGEMLKPLRLINAMIQQLKYAVPILL